MKPGTQSPSIQNSCMHDIIHPLNMHANTHPLNMHADTQPLNMQTPNHSTCKHPTAQHASTCKHPTTQHANTQPLKMQRTHSYPSPALTTMMKTAQTARMQMRKQQGTATVGAWRWRQDRLPPVGPPLPLLPPPPPFPPHQFLGQLSALLPSARVGHRPWCRFRQMSLQCRRRHRPWWRECHRQGGEVEVGEEDPAGAPSLGVRVRQERVPAALMGSHLRFPGPLTMWLVGRLCFLRLVAARFEE